MPDQTPISTVASSTEAEETVLSGTANSVIKTDVQYAVDFSYLQAVAPNSIAWLYQPGTTINQPVMYCGDSGYYLRRTFNDRISSNGAIFMTGDETPDFSASEIVLYGRTAWTTRYSAAFPIIRTTPIIRRTRPFTC